MNERIWVQHREFWHLDKGICKSNVRTNHKSVITDLKHSASLSNDFEPSNDGIPFSVLQI